MKVCTSIGVCVYSYIQVTFPIVVNICTGKPPKKDFSSDISNRNTSNRTFFNAMPHKHLLPFPGSISIIYIVFNRLRSFFSTRSVFTWMLLLTIKIMIDTGKLLFHNKHKKKNGDNNNNNMVVFERNSLIHSSREEAQDDVLVSEEKGSIEINFPIKIFQQIKLKEQFPPRQNRYVREVFFLIKFIKIFLA